MTEIWKDIYDGEGYQISNYGRVKSLVRRKHIIMKARVEKRLHSSRPMLRVDLDRSLTKGWRKDIFVHAEVMRAFLPNERGDRLIIFKDGDSLNCRVDNLLWFWDAPPLYPENIRDFKKSVKTEIGRNVVKFLEGDSTALDGFVRKFMPKIERRLRGRFGAVGGTKIEDAVMLAFSNGFRDIRRGLLKKDGNLVGWFYVSARGKLINSFGEDKGMISNWQFNTLAHSGDFLADSFEQMAATN